MQASHKIFFITGASGAGKTTAAKRLEKMGISSVTFCYFDSIGVPSADDMVKEFGSVEAWQRAKTIEWVEKIQREYLVEKDVLLDGQMRPSFIDEACKKYGVHSYEVILFDCSDEVRTQRLTARGHADLANDQMMNWAKYLRDACRENGRTVLDTSSLSIDKTVRALMSYLGT